MTRGSVQQDLAGFPLYVQIDSVELERLRTEGLALDPLQMAGDAYLAVMERGGRELLDLESVEQHKIGLEE